jgi:PPOX class probable F420-dependent enzyme
MHLEAEAAAARAAAADHAILATINRTGAPDLVPVCFAMVGDVVAIPVDSVKPKRSTALGRIRNLERDPRATLLVEHWDAADWSRLWWVRASLVRASVDGDTAGALVARLRERYPQYADVTFDALLTFRIERIGGWEATA